MFSTRRVLPNVFSVALCAFSNPEEENTLPETARPKRNVLDASIFSLDGRRGPPDVLPLSRRQTGNRSVNGVPEEEIDGGRTAGNAIASGSHATSPSSSRGVGASASADSSDRDTNKAETADDPPALWPSGGGGRGGRRWRGVPPGVTVTDTIPARLRYVVVVVVVGGGGGGLKRALCTRRTFRGNLQLNSMCFPGLLVSCHLLARAAAGTAGSFSVPRSSTGMKTGEREDAVGERNGRGY